MNRRPLFPCPHDDTLDGPCPGGPRHTDPWPVRLWDLLAGRRRDAHGQLETTTERETDPQ